MNSFGTLFKVQIFGESHGDCVGIVIDGCPAGLPLQQADFVEDMERRKGESKKEQHQDKKMIFLFSNLVFLMIRPQVRH